MNEIKQNNQVLLRLIEEWEPKLLALPEEVITCRRNEQNRTIKQIIGHIVDSATNNTHRIVHLHYQPGPLIFPNYASEGNNDRWIAIQNYQDEKWENLVQLWKHVNLHIVHVINQVDPEKLKHEWIAGPGNCISLEMMIIDYLRHFELHLSEIDELIKKESN